MCNTQEIKNIILDSDVISFDIFDTLFFRIVNQPEDIFVIIEKKLKIQDFVNIRINGQRLASLEVNKKYQYPHANIDEIYEYISRNNETCSGIDWNQIKLYEIQLELDCIIQNEEMYKLYKFAKDNGKRVIATSDMYLNKIYIEKMLEKCNYNDFDYLYISADERRTKYNGDLFDEVIHNEKQLYEKIVHIGDNKKDDYDMAISKGIKSYHYIPNKVSDKKNNYCICDSLAEGISRILANRNEINFWYYLGAKVGGNLYLGLINWFLEKIKNAQYDNIYFLSRDGYILYNILKKMGVSKIQYLYTSRRSLLLAGITKLDDESMNNLPPYTYGQTVEEILDYLDFKDIDDESIIKSGFISRQSVIKTKKDFTKMHQLFLSCETYILKQCEKERENARKYFEKVGLLDSKSIIFDCGWNGSSQFLLDKVLNSIDTYKGENYFLYAGILENEKSNRQLNGKNYDCYFFGKGKNRSVANALISNIVLLELFFGAPHDSVWKYGEEGPELENIESTHKYKEQICNGILDYIEIAFPFLSKYNITFSVDDSISQVLRLIQNPSEAEAINIGNLSNVDGFVHQKSCKKFIAKLGLKDIIKNPNIEVYWPQALIKRKDINFLVKLLVSKRYHITKTRIKNRKIIKSPVIQKLKTGVKILINEGPLTLFYHINNRKQQRKNKLDIYTKWIIDNEKGVLTIESLNYEPLISIVVPVYNVLNDQLIACIESVIKQTYKKWELCLVDDASTWEDVRVTLKKYEGNPNIKIVYRKENGHISSATNSGIEIAEGEFIAFLDCDDVLAPNALYEMAKKVNENREYDFIYSDEDKLTADGTKRHSPFFKPDWSPDSFMSLMYTCHFAMYKRSIVNELGGLRVGFEGAQDYDFTLRFVEKAGAIGHIPKILYHWREREESIASNPESKPYALKAVKRCKEEALKRRGLEGEVVYVPDMFQYRVNYISKNCPKVSIIIVTNGNNNNLTQCVESIIGKTTYKNFEIIIIDNCNKGEDTNYNKELCQKYKCSYYSVEKLYNISELYNIGTSYATGDFFLFLNEDILIGSPEWLDLLVGQCELRHIGAVGTKILYNNTNRIEHCGMINLESGPCFSFYGFDDQYCYYYGRNRMDYNCFAVSGGCLIIQRIKFEEVGGFNKDCNNNILCDVDLCSKLIHKGYYNFVKNNSIMYINKSYEDIPAINLATDEIDPFYSKNLTKRKTNFEINTNLLEKMNSVSNISKLDIDKRINQSVVGVIDSVENGQVIKIEGWGFMKSTLFKNMNKIQLLLINNEGYGYKVKTNTIYRPDVTAAFDNESNLNLTGFQCYIDRNLIIKNNYKICILVKDAFRIRKGILIFDKAINMVK